MILVEYLPRMRHVDALAGTPAPGEAGQEFQVGANDAVFGRDGWQFLESRKFAICLFQCLFGHLCFVHLAAQFVDGGLFFALFAEFALDGLELLAQQVFALHLAHFFLGAGLNFFAEFENFQFVAQETTEVFELGAH